MVGTLWPDSCGGGWGGWTGCSLCSRLMFCRIRLKACGVQQVFTSLDGGWTMKHQQGSFCLPLLKEKERKRKLRIYWWIKIYSYHGNEKTCIVVYFILLVSCLKLCSSCTQRKKVWTSNSKISTGNVVISSLRVSATRPYMSPSFQLLLTSTETENLYVYSVLVLLFYFTTGVSNLLSLRATVTKWNCQRTTICNI